MYGDTVIVKIFHFLYIVNYCQNLTNMYEQIVTNKANVYVRYNYNYC